MSDSQTGGVLSHGGVIVGGYVCTAARGLTMTHSTITPLHVADLSVTWKTAPAFRRRRSGMHTDMWTDRDRDKQTPNIIDILQSSPYSVPNVIAHRQQMPVINVNVSRHLLIACLPQSTMLATRLLFYVNCRLSV